MVFLNKGKLSCEYSVISENRGAFWNPKNQRFHRNRGSFKVKVSDFFNMENTDGLHKFPVSGGTGLRIHGNGNKYNLTLY